MWADKMKTTGKGILHRLNPLRWLVSVANVWRQEFRLVFHDQGVTVFFVVLAFVYPILYSSIYNPEVANNESVVVVDDCRSPLSRQFVRDFDAAPEVKVVNYAPSMDSARLMMATKQCYGILHIPSNFETAIAAGSQGHVSLYCDMSVMMRYKSMLTALTNVQMLTCTRLQGEKMASLGAASASTGGMIVESRHVPLGNKKMGIASAVLPFILVYVLQQGLILGVGMLRAGSWQRRRRNQGEDRLAVDAPPGAMLIGKTLCHVIIYVLPCIAALWACPLLFKFPMNADMREVLTLMLPMIISSSLLGQVLANYVNTRESVFLVLGFTSLIFVFLTGVSWPTSSTPKHWQAVAAAVPGYWGATAYVRMQVQGASLAQVQPMFIALWKLCGCYFVLAYLVEVLVNRPRIEALRLLSKADWRSIRDHDMRLNGDD